jgi:hypothetical protein
MIELIAVAGTGTGYALLVTTRDLLSDRPGLAGHMEVLRLLSRNMVASITQSPRDDAQRIDAWLIQHAGTTELSQDDKDFFAEQLRLARQKVGC